MLPQNQVNQLDAVANNRGNLGGEFFTSETLFTEERRAIFAGGWMCVGTVDDAAAPSSIYPLQAAGEDLLLVRDREGTLRAFFNHCSHRGAILAEQPRRNCATIVCPYHSWTYTLSGELRRMPHVGGPGVHEGEGLDASKLGLREIPLRDWAGLVFVNMSGTAQDFDEFIAPMKARLGDYDLSLLHLSGEAGTVVNANWKVVVENFVESYHLPWVHPSMNRYNPMEDHYQILGGDLYIGQGLLGLEFEDAAANLLPRFPNLKPEQMTTGESHFIFSNLLFGVMIEMAYAVILLPEAVGRTRERVVVMVNGEEAATAPQFKEARDILLERIVSVNAEDIGITESVHRGRSSPAFVGGQFSPVHERTTHQFQRAYALRMLRAEGHPLADVALGYGEVHLPRGESAEPAEKAVLAPR